MRFKHFIITRFNATLLSEPVHLEREGVSKRYDPVWLEQRVKYFEKVCSPTIRNQTNKDFIHLMVFGNETPADFILKLQAKHDFVPVVGSQWRLHENLDSTIRNLKGNANYIITTNVDSDDGISTDFIQQVQNQFQPRDMGIYVTCGVRWNLADDTYTTTQSIQNAFHTIVEPVTSGAVRTVMSLSHGQIHGYYGEIVQIQNKTTRWLAGIHGGNLVNRVRLTSEDKPKPFSEVSYLFGL